MCEWQILVPENLQHIYFRSQMAQLIFLNQHLIKINLTTFLKPYSVILVIPAF